MAGIPISGTSRNQPFLVIIGTDWGEISWQALQKNLRPINPQRKRRLDIDQNLQPLDDTISGAETRSNFENRTR